MEEVLIFLIILAFLVSLLFKPIGTKLRRDLVNLSWIKGVSPFQGRENIWWEDGCHIPFMTLLYFSKFLHKLLVNHVGVVSFLKNFMWRIFGTWFRQSIQVKYFSSHILHVHVTKYISHFILSDELIISLPDNSSDFFIYSIPS